MANVHPPVEQKLGDYRPANPVVPKSEDYSPKNPVVQELVDQIEGDKDFKTAMQKAIITANQSGVKEMEDVVSLEDFYRYINDLLRWVPSENVQGKDIYNALCKFYFVFDQPSVSTYQDPIQPSHAYNFVSTNQDAIVRRSSLNQWSLSDWLLKYAKEMGSFLSTPDSITPKSVQTFKASPNYNMDDYYEPEGSWHTFNEFFARTLKANRRPISAYSDDTVIVSPADSTFDGQWEIRANSGVTIKNVHWKISELLQDSDYKDSFQNGVFIHAFLSPSDYHRIHAPFAGQVLEARIIPGNVYLDVVAVDVEDGQKYLSPVRSFDALDSTGYQFAQARGLVTLKSLTAGLVAVLPVGMAQVSSVILSCKKGDLLAKGDEIAYFQFGGSDVVLVFEKDSNVSISAQVGVHYKVGTTIGKAYRALNSVRGN